MANYLYDYGKEQMFTDISQVTSSTGHLGAIHQLQQWLDRVTYKPNFHLTLDGSNLQVQMQVPNTHDPQHRDIDVRAPFPIPPHVLLSLDEREFFRWVRECIHWVERHEADEWLLVDGMRKWDPHA